MKYYPAVKVGIRYPTRSFTSRIHGGEGKVSPLCRRARELERVGWCDQDLPNRLHIPLHQGDQDALVGLGSFGVVHAQGAANGGQELWNGYRPVHNTTGPVHASVRPITCSPLMPPSGQDHRESRGPVVRDPGCHIDPRRASKLAHPDHQGGVEQLAFLQIAQQRAPAHIELPAQPLDRIEVVPVGVPAAQGDDYYRDFAFDQPPRQRSSVARTDVIHRPGEPPVLRSLVSTARAALPGSHRRRPVHQRFPERPRSSGSLHVPHQSSSNSVGDDGWVPGSRDCSTGKNRLPSRR